MDSINHTQQAMARLLIISWLLISLLTGSRANDYNIVNFGAVPDTSVLSTNAIQKAIDECFSHGGGVVIIPSGNFKTGTIILKSNVTLYLQPGAILFGSRNLDDYADIKPKFVSLRTQEATKQLIYAENSENVTITGFGEINGQGAKFKKMSWNDEGITRPHLMRFITCNNVRVENISLKNSGCWMQHYLACTNLQIKGLKIYNHNNFNNDGLDIDGCRNVTISDVISDSDDDGITLKSTSDRICENVAITNCVVSSHCNAIKLGTESNGGFKNISISNCVVKPSAVTDTNFFGSVNGTSGISLEIVDGGALQGVVINNISIDGTESPLFIRLANRARPYKKDMEKPSIGTLGDVLISNVVIRNAKRTGCSITGLPGHPVTNIRLSNITAEFEGGGLISDANREIGEKEADYPDATMFGNLPSYGFFVRHASGIEFDGLKITTKSDDARPAFLFTDVENAVVNSVQMSSSDKCGSNVVLSDTKNVKLMNCEILGRSNCLAKITGAATHDVFIIDNFLKNVSEIFSLKDVSEKEIHVRGNFK